MAATEEMDIEAKPEVGKKFDTEKLECKVCFCDLAKESMMCRGCGHGCCAPCARDYIIRNPEMACPNKNCDQQWDLQTLVELPFEFSKDCRLPLIEFFLKREQTKIWPELMPYYRQLLDAVEDLKKTDIGSDDNKRVNIIIRSLKGRLLELPLPNNETPATAEALSSTNKNFIVIKCPADGCDSVIGQDGVCMRNKDPICGTRVCIKCRYILTNETISTHVCNPDEVKSIEEIMNISKPCPQCYVPITKPGGCYEMFCTNCNTSFDWGTLKKIAGNHNEYLMAWLRNRNNGAPMPAHDCEAPITSEVIQPRLNGMPEDFIKRVNAVLQKHLERREEDNRELQPLNQTLARMRMALWLSGFMFPLDYQKALFQQTMIAMHKQHDRGVHRILDPEIDARLHLITRAIDGMDGKKSVTPELETHLNEAEELEKHLQEVIKRFDTKIRKMQDLTDIPEMTKGLPEALLSIKIPDE
jgi:hypothetical protein